MKSLRFTLVALVALSMFSFTSCKDNGEEGKNNGGVAEGTFSVTFGEQTWNAGWTDCGITSDNSGNPVLFVNACPQNPSVTQSYFPMLYFNVGTSTGRHMVSTDQNLFMMYFYAKVFNLQDQGGNIIMKNCADYWAGNGPQSMGSANIEITALDVNTLTVTLKGEGEFWNAMDVFQSKDPDIKAFKIVANKFKLTPRASSAAQPGVSQFVAEMPCENNIVM